MTSLTWIITGLVETVGIRENPYMGRVSPDGGDCMANPCDGNSSPIQSNALSLTRASPKGE